jgi:hypothetical protein
MRHAWHDREWKVGARVSDRDRDLLQRKHPPTAVRNAIAQGSQPIPSTTPVPRVITSSDAVANQIADEPSTPIGISQLDRIEFRQQANEQNILELARGVGDNRIEGIKHTVALEALVKLAEKADEREQKREDAQQARDVRREERDAETAKDKRTSRERILLAILGVIATAATGFGIGSKLSSGQTVTVQSPALAPSHVGTP